MALWMNIHSCQTNSMYSGNGIVVKLSSVIDDWAKILDKQGQVDTFIMDFEKKPLTPRLMNFIKANCSAMALEEKQ